MPFSLQIAPPDYGDPARAREVRSFSRETYGRPRDEVEAEIEELVKNIQENLNLHAHGEYNAKIGLYQGEHLIGTPTGPEATAAGAEEKIGGVVYDVLRCAGRRALGRSDAQPLPI